MPLSAEWAATVQALAAIASLGVSAVILGVTVYYARLTRGLLMRDVKPQVQIRVLRGRPRC